jgi:hypothetical protein
VEQRRRAGVLLAERQRLLAEAIDPPADAEHELARDDRRVVMVVATWRRSE